MNLNGSWSYIENIARSRLEHNKTPRHVYEYGDELEILGVAGELCARRFLGLEEKLHEGFDGGKDIQFFGTRIDVKATVLTPKLQYRNLQWTEGKWVKSDVILMVAVNIERRIATPVGYATKEEIEKAPVNYKRPYPCHEIPIEKLHQPYLLLSEGLRNFNVIETKGSKGRQSGGFGVCSQA